MNKIARKMMSWLPGFTVALENAELQDRPEPQAFTEQKARANARTIKATATNHKVTAVSKDYCVLSYKRVIISDRMTKEQAISLAKKISTEKGIGTIVFHIPEK